MKILRKTNVGPNLTGSYKKECNQNGTVEINIMKRTITTGCILLW